MTSIHEQGDWMPIDRTFVPALPHRSRLMVHEVSPERFEVTYPTNASGLYWILVFVFMFVGWFPLTILALMLGLRFPWLPVISTYFGIVAGIPISLAWLISRIYKRHDGGRISIEQGRLRADFGVFLCSRQEICLEDQSRFSVEDVGSESTNWTLKLFSMGKKLTLAHEGDLQRPDMHWLCHRMNEYLGHEFPSHCVNCGRPLEAVDVDWPQRGVYCSGCGFASPVPDPFELDAITEAPVEQCPSCFEPIWLPNVNRDTGGSRCRRCGWSSNALPPSRLESRQDLSTFASDAFEQGVRLAFRYQEHLLSAEQIRDEFPTDLSALDELRIQNLLEEMPEKTATVNFRHHQTTGLWWVFLGTVLLIALLTEGCLTTTKPQGLGLLGLFSHYWLFRFVWCFAVGVLGLLIWWSRQSVRLIFTPYALLLAVGKRKRLIAWHTLTEVAVFRHSWPPVLMLLHGGAGVVIVTTTKSAATALVRLCQSYRDRAPDSVLPKLIEES